MTMDTPEIASLFGALDSSGIIDGGAVNAHMLRVLAMTSNRLVSKGHVLTNVVWPDDNVVAESVGQLRGIAWPWWHNILPPIPTPKKPGLTTADLEVVVSITSRVSEGTVEVQTVTGAARYQPGASSAANILQMVGSGSSVFEVFGMDNIPIASGSMDEVSFLLRGIPTGDTAQAADGGTPSTGTVGRVGPNWFEPTVGASWTFTTPSTLSNWANTGHYVDFTVSSVAVVPLVSVINVVQAGNDRIYFYPYLNADQQQMINGTTYTIKQLPRYNMANLALYANARTV